MAPPSRAPKEVVRGKIKRTGRALGRGNKGPCGTGMGDKEGQRVRAEDNCWVMIDELWAFGFRRVGGGGQWTTYVR